MRPLLLSTALLATIALLLPLPARAQGAPGKPVLPPIAAEVIVTQSASGDELRGRLVELSATTLAILVNGKRIDLPIESVLRIDVRGDSVKDGAAIGAALLGGLSLIGCAEMRTTQQCVTAVILDTGFGALIGAGIDALHQGRTTIYRKPAPVAFAVAPAGKGARLQLKVSF
jgi:hypothetical protein